MMLKGPVSLGLGWEAGRLNQEAGESSEVRVAEKCQRGQTHCHDHTTGWGQSWKWRPSIEGDPPSPCSAHSSSLLLDSRVRYAVALARPLRHARSSWHGC